MDLSIELEAKPEAAHEGREAIRERFADALPSEMLHDLALVATELLSNSVAHGPGEPVRLQARLRPDGSVWGEVVDQGDAGTAAPAILEDQDGLGLLIVDALVERWGVQEGTTHLWFELGPYPRRESG